MCKLSFRHNKYKTNYNFNHEPTDSDMCDILKNKIQKYIDSVVFTVKPKIDRYIGKIHKMESNKQRHDASEKLQTIPQMIKNKSALQLVIPRRQIQQQQRTHLFQQLHLPQQTQQPRQQLHLPQQTQQPRQHRNKSPLNHLHLR